jgi:hypothetical protein
MTENANMDDNSLENSTNTESEKPSNESISSDEADNITPNKENQNMETHAHHLHHAPGEKIWHYFFEFLMLFFAVFCGFLAENLRENKIERDREKVYMNNLYQDLKSDTAIYSNYDKSSSEFFNNVDSLVMLMKSPGRDTRLSNIYFLARTATTRSLILFPNERTFDQMKYSGYLRLISNRQVADSVSSYYNSLKDIVFFNEIIKDRLTDYMTVMGKVFDAEIMFKILKEGKVQISDSAKLLSNDALVINELLTRAQYLYGSTLLQKNREMGRSRSAQNLIELIKKEYHFE